MARQELLHYVLHNDHRSRLVLYTSLSDEDAVIPYSNGFIHTMLRAWQQDLHLELRPDDVWLAVLAQISFFVNGQGRAEALRHYFVVYEGQRQLVVECRGCNTIQDVDMTVVMQRFVTLAQDQLVDPGLSDWLLPTFSTTQPHDRSVAAAVFLGTMRQYFNYRVILGCGFPSVTLHGEHSDWVALAACVARLGDFAIVTGLGDDNKLSMQHWTLCLSKAIEYMIASFDRPDDADVRDFWMHACHWAGEGASGDQATLSGWLTAFSWWKADGLRQKVYQDAELAKMWHPQHDDWRRYDLDGVRYPVINYDQLPAGFTRAPLIFQLHHSDGGN